MKPINPGLAVLVAGMLSACTALAQDAVPGEILNRTLSIKVGNETGTAFSIDYEGKLYLVTARHVTTGLPETKATIEIQRSGKWISYQTKRTLFPKSQNADIAVFETGETLEKPFGVRTSDLGGVTMGQQVWFLGYPYGGLGSHWSNGEAPFIKRGTMSAIDASNPDAVVVYIDGFNNPGFSGGPIVYWDFSKHVYGIVGVVMGYREDTAKVLVNGVPVDAPILVNSGILIGYSIDHAIQAIKDSQSQQR
jgi:hypothetical protein